MADARGKQKSKWLAVIAVGAIIAAVAILAVSKRLSRTAEPAAHSGVHTHQPDSGQAQDPPGSGQDKPNSYERTPATNTSGPKTLTLIEIARGARTWQPIYTFWYGRATPDFSVKDINGKEHTLSDYRGKNVMVILWATWCPPCRTEIPHLIELRNRWSKDELVMLAISFINRMTRETPQKVKTFVTGSPINYTIISAQPRDVPGPYNRPSAYPSTFFIDKQGIIKFATTGTLNLGEFEAILRAER